MYDCGAAKINLHLDAVDLDNCEVLVALREFCSHLFQSFPFASATARPCGQLPLPIESMNCCSHSDSF